MSWLDPTAQQLPGSTHDQRGASPIVWHLSHSATGVYAVSTVTACVRRAGCLCCLLESLHQTSPLLRANGGKSRKHDPKFNVPHRSNPGADQGCCGAIQKYGAIGNAMGLGINKCAEKGTVVSTATEQHERIDTPMKTDAITLVVRATNWANRRNAPRTRRTGSETRNIRPNANHRQTKLPWPRCDAGGHK